MIPRAIFYPLLSRWMLLSLSTAAALASTSAATLTAPAATPAQPTAPLGGIQIVLQNGFGLPLSAVVLKGDKYELKTEVGKFAVGATIPVTAVDHVFGDKPPAINQAIALLLTGEPAEGEKLLIPILAEHKDTAKLPGNFWLEAARVSLVANALQGAAAQCEALAKDILAIAPTSGADPFAALGKALLMPKSTKLEDRQAALKALTTDVQPADVCAYASYFLAGLLKSAKHDGEALEAYLAVPCLYPSGGMVLNGVAQLKAAELLTTQGRHKEAVGLVESAIRFTKGTVARVLASKLYESVK
ncbi:MAG: hypothetical protein DVB26_02490 [Verrucomicrobia bacterium]|nr:MAG: hypothetical protein DVB26_02490 [Verrucomicrobiota bacterium]